MVNYVKSAAMAKRLIEANGRYVVLVRKGTVSSDTAKPWREPTGEISSDPVKGLIYPIEERDESGGLYRTGREKVMIAYDSLGSDFDLTHVDRIVDVSISRSYKVVAANIIGPGDVMIAYEFEVKS